MIRLLPIILLLQGCQTLEWTNQYGTDFCAYPSGIIVGTSTTTAALLVNANPYAALELGVTAGGTMLLNSWSNYGGLDVEDCIDSYKRNVLDDNKK